MNEHQPVLVDYNESAQGALKDILCDNLVSVAN